MKNTEIIKLLEQNELTEDVSISYFVSDEGNKTISVYFYSSDIELEYDTDNRDVTVHTRSLGKIQEKQFLEVIRVFFAMQNIALGKIKREEEVSEDVPIAAPQVCNTTKGDIEIFEEDCSITVPREETYTLECQAEAGFWKDHERWLESQKLTSEQKEKLASKIKAASNVGAIILFDELNRPAFCGLYNEPIKYIQVYAIDVELSDKTIAHREQAIVYYQNKLQYFSAAATAVNHEVPKARFDNYANAFVYQLMPEDIETWASLAYEGTNVATYRKDFFRNIND